MSDCHSTSVCVYIYQYKCNEQQHATFSHWATSSENKKKISNGRRMVGKQHNIWKTVKQKRIANTINTSLQKWVLLNIKIITEVRFYKNSIWKKKHRNCISIDQGQRIGSADGGDMDKHFTDAKSYILSATTKDGVNLWVYIHNNSNWKYWNHLFLC